MTWKCSICGYENPDDAVFCLHCGAKKPEAREVSENAEVPQINEQLPQEGENIQLSEQQTPQSTEQQVTGELKENASEQQSISEPSLPQTSSALQTEIQDQKKEETIQEQQSQQVQESKYYIIFIATPASALNKSKVPLDFDVFENISLGRSPENVIVIPDSEISRRHAVLSLKSGVLYIEDLNSTNGTYIYDGKVFQPIKGSAEISPNTVVKLGNSTIIKIVRE
ncbi:FHA domain-containing protein [Acidianus sp. RZ1]|uniref:FHA domain-containing protein n=1 Tax=Acidianus sp. RZ1 TaxID=1540082 RepID=UPI0014912F61|nr:FHA domain-containing protein [Acidianus sp. RZ1]NON63161.1 FHA domain-containing protein [Acidianus sp. RZ1]